MNCLKDFFSTVDATEPLSDNEVLHLCARAREGDTEARDRIWRGHLRLISYIAKRFYRSDGFCEWGDLMQQGSLGILRAIERFDASRQCSGRPVSFSLYATYWIAHAIRREIQNRGRTVKLPVYLQQELTRWKQKMRGMRPVGERHRFLDQQRLSLADQVFYSLDASAQEHGEEGPRSRHLWMGDWDRTEQTVVQDQLGRVVQELVQSLPTRESFIVQKHYGIRTEEVPYAHLAREMGISSERVRQLQRRGLDRLKQALRAYPELHPGTV